MSAQIYDIEEIRGTYKSADGTEIPWFDENAALGHLLLDEILFCNQCKYVEIDGTATQFTTVIFMLCNDVFMWGCADGEPLLNDDIEPLFMMWHENKKWGPTRWVCIKRNEQPQGPIVRDMKIDGAWDAVMDALPANIVDVFNAKKRAEQAISEHIANSPYVGPYAGG
jgi:hypothetical protein